MSGANIHYKDGMVRATLLGKVKVDEAFKVENDVLLTQREVTKVVAVTIEVEVGEGAS